MPTSTGTATLAMLTLDCADVGPVSAFWAQLLGYEVVASGDEYAMLKGPEGPALGFGQVADYEPPGWPNDHGSKQFHLDLAVDDIDAAAARAVELGATLADPQPGETWRVLLDPAGHPFCLTRAENWG
jgi:catechol 2,3-dioxygenase-like lactoylglutathione lyase family enzyme